jgi:hypothetical protein
LLPFRPQRGSKVVPQSAREVVAEAVRQLLEVRAAAVVVVVALRLFLQVRPRDFRTESRI